MIQMALYTFAFLMTRKEVKFDLSGMDMIRFLTLFILVEAISAHGHLIPQIGIIYSTVLKLLPSELLKTP